MNIAFVSSLGGHSGQIKIIFTNEVIGDNNAILITEKKKSNNEIKEKGFNNKFRVYYFEKDILLRMNPFTYLNTLFRLIKMLRKEKINLIVTNGAQISIPAVIAARILGIKSLFIDTIIRVKSPNWSAKFCYYFVDMFLVQHKNMISKYGKKAEYHGGIL